MTEKLTPLEKRLIAEEQKRVKYGASDKAISDMKSRDVENPYDAYRIRRPRQDPNKKKSTRISLDKLGHIYDLLTKENMTIESVSFFYGIDPDVIIERLLRRGYKI